MSLLNDEVVIAPTRLFPRPHNIKTFIFDLDGTLLNGHHELADLTVSTLQALRATGVNLVIATGRHINDIRCYLQQLGGGIAAITCNGANIHTADGELIHSGSLAQTVSELLIPIGQQFNVHTNLYTSDEWLVGAPCEAILAAHARSQFFYRQVEHEQLIATAALKILFFGEEQALQSVKDEIHKRKTTPLNVTFSDVNYLEIMQENISKGHALKILLGKLGLAVEHTMAFGDSMNDVELLRTVAHPIVMQNAGAGLQQLFPAAHRAQHHHSDGVARFLLDHVL